MLTQNLIIKKGAIYAYRLFDIAHEINLKEAKSLLGQEKFQTVKPYQLKKDPLRSIVFKEAPLIVSGGDDKIIIKLDDKEFSLNSHLEIKVWNYGVISLSYKIILEENTSWKELIKIGAILDSDSIIDTLSIKKRDELTASLSKSLKNPHTHSIFEDYTTYLIEELVVAEKNKENNQIENKKIAYPMDVLKTTGVAELLLAEPTKTLSESTHKAIQSNFSQYTKQDLLIMDWNSALVMDFGKEKEYQDYVDILEFSLAQLLELRIYDELLDEKLDELYDSLEKKQYNKITEFYSKMSEDSSHLYMEFSDFFEKLDNSIKTVGDFYLAKILKTADRKFGFDELKRSMSRKIQALSDISKMCQTKVDSIIDTQRNSTSHRLEWIVIILIGVEVVPSLYKTTPELYLKLYNYLISLF